MSVSTQATESAPPCAPKVTAAISPVVSCAKRRDDPEIDARRVDVIARGAEASRSLATERAPPCARKVSTDVSRVVSARSGDEHRRLRERSRPLRAMAEDSVTNEVVRMDVLMMRWMILVLSRLRRLRCLGSAALARLRCLGSAASAPLFSHRPTYKRSLFLFLFCGSNETRAVTNPYRSPVRSEAARRKEEERASKKRHVRRTTALPVHRLRECGLVGDLERASWSDCLGRPRCCRLDSSEIKEEPEARWNLFNQGIDSPTIDAPPVGPSQPRHGPLPDRRRPLLGRDHCGRDLRIARLHLGPR